MSTTDNNEPIYNWTYRHGVDEKRRLQIPAKWRPASPEVRFTLIPWPKGVQKEAFLAVFPPPVMNDLVQKLKAMPYSDSKAQALRRLLGGKSDTVVLDKVGRICLPEAMAKAAGIEAEAVLVGSVDRFEIWSPERHAAASEQDDSLSSEAFNLI
ncbi:MAG: transcriptional regulator MraZ [Verrucomicrobiota bacterium]